MSQSLDKRLDVAKTAGMTVYLPKWLRTGFQLSAKASSTSGSAESSRAAAKQDLSKLVKNTDLIKHLLVLLRRRSSKAGVTFKHVPAHAGWEGNEAADVSIAQHMSLSRMHGSIS